MVAEAPERTNIRLAGKQAKAATWCDKRLNIWDGAVRSGKTVSSLIAWLIYASKAPPGDLLMIGKTERTLKRNIISPLLDMAGDVMKYRQGEGEFYINGRRCYIVGANDERAENKIRGLTAAGAYGDEITLWPESFFQMLLSRLSVEGARFYGTTNPDSPAHWLKTKYLDRREELDMRVFKFRLEDNPHLPPAYVNALKKEYTGLWYRRYILGDWVAAEGAIFDMLDPDIHLVDTLPPLSRHFMAIDYGTTNPTVWAYLSQGDDGIWYIHHGNRWDSLVNMRQKTDAEYSADFLKHVRETKIYPSTVWVDPSAASFSLQLWRDMRRATDFEAVNISPAENEVLDGIRDVSSMLAAGILKIHRPSVSPKMFDELVGYAWDSKAQEKGEDKPIKSNDHDPDAIRYMVRGAKRYWRHQIAA